MALLLDTSHPFSTAEQLSRLVEAVLTAGNEDEAKWIEWKSTLNLASTEGQGHLARQVIGFANRDPDLAQRWAGGFAYIIVGAEPGANPPSGVTPVDAATLEPQLAKWVPGEIVWHMDYVAVGDVKVLVVSVDPPAWGDPIHTLRKPLGNFAAGTVFVRHQASIEPASPTDVAMLARRFTEGRVRTRIEVLPMSEQIETRPDIEKYIAAWLVAEERELTNPDHPLAGGDEEWSQHANRLSSYFRQATSAIRDRANRLLPLRKIAPLRLSVHSLIDHTLEDVELTVEFHGHGQQQLLQADLDEVLLTELPDRPMLPGQVSPALTPEQQRRIMTDRSRRVQRQLELSEQIDRDPHSMDIGLTNAVRVDRVVVTYPGENVIKLVFPRFVLRAQQILQLPDVPLDLFEPEGAACEIVWSATSHNRPGVASGRFQVTTAVSSLALARVGYPYPGRSIRA